MIVQALKVETSTIDISINYIFPYILALNLKWELCEGNTRLIISDTQGKEKKREGQKSECDDQRERESGIESNGGRHAVTSTSSLQS